MTLRRSGEFDHRFYRATYPQVGREGVNPLLHFVEQGWRAGYDPNRGFNTRSYLERRPELLREGTNPLAHFLRSGGAADGRPEPAPDSRAAAAQLRPEEYSRGELRRSYRAFVGPAKYYDVIGGLQFSILLHAGLREHHTLLDLGCGSLRGGRLFIPYLKPDRYYGVEPESELIDGGLARELGTEIVTVKRPRFSTIDDFSLGALGVEFDFVLAQSIFSHTFPDLASIGFAGVRDCLAPDGVLLATYRARGNPIEGSGWLYPGAVPYEWETLRSLLEGAGLHARQVKWPHPKQEWFAAARDEVRVDEVADRLRAGEELQGFGELP